VCDSESIGHVLENDVAPVLHLLSILLGDEFVDPVEEIDVDLNTHAHDSEWGSLAAPEKERKQSPLHSWEANRLNALLLAQLLRPTLTEIERFVATLCGVRGAAALMRVRHNTFACVCVLYVVCVLRERILWA
jgi:hypothetical protein